MRNKIEREKRVVEAMIRLYCRKNEGNKNLCAECSALLEYAHARLDHCKFGDHKGRCQDCTVHCYAPSRRQQIRTVMRWSGPRMMLYHPLMAFRHLLKL